MTLSHKTCISTSGQGFKKTLFAINAIFTKKDPIGYQCYLYYSLSMLSLLVKIASIANRVFLKPFPEVLIQVL